MCSGPKTRHEYVHLLWNAERLPSRLFSNYDDEKLYRFLANVNFRFLFLCSRKCENFPGMNFSSLRSAACNEKEERETNNFTMVLRQFLLLCFFIFITFSCDSEKARARTAWRPAC